MTAPGYIWMVLRDHETAQLVNPNDKGTGLGGFYVRTACGQPFPPMAARAMTLADKACGRCQRTKLSR